MFRKVLGVSTCFIVLLSFAKAGPTGLNAMPTADCLGHKELYVSYGVSGTERSISKDISHAAGFQAGIGGNIELGYDHDLRSSGSANIKVNLHSGKKLSVSAGLMGIADGESQKYVVAAYAIGENARIHGGWLNDGTDRWMAGYDMSLCENGTLMIDTIGGSDSYSYVGVNWVIPKLSGFDVTVSAGIPHQRENGYTYTVTLGYATRL